MHSSRVHLMVTPEEVKVGLTRINGVSGLEILSAAQLVRLSLTANNNSV